MITKEEILEKLLETRIGDKHRAVLKLALKGLEHEKIEGQEFIPLGEHLLVVGGLSRSRNLWRKKHDELADELDDKIIALEDKLKAKDADLAEASKIINDARAKHRALEIQTDHLRNGRLQAEDQIAVLEDKLRDTVTLKYHDAIVDSANQIIVPLRKERDAFKRLVGEMHTEKSCMRADLENVCKELSVLKIEIEKWEEAHHAKNADIDKLFTENEKLARRERELMIVLGEWAAVEVYLAKSPKLTIGDKFSVACLRLLQERDDLKGENEVKAHLIAHYKSLRDAWQQQAGELKAKLKKFEDFFVGED